MKMKTYIERIRDTRSGFSPSFERLADYLLDSYAHAALLTATELGHNLDIDTATVVRFAQYLGYKGYPELQQEIRKKVKDELLADVTTEPNSSSEAAETALIELAQGLELTRRSFPIDDAEMLITALDEAQRVILLAEGLALAPARNLSSWLEAAGYNIHLAGGSLSDLARALAGARKGDMIIVIEVDEALPYLSRAISESKALEIRTAAFVSSPSSPAAQHAEFVLAAYKTPHPGAGQILVEAMIFAFVRMLFRARPGRFEDITERIAHLRQRLARENGL
ncbi:MAG: SIS domain-containing protein [Anaerolineales bacterium]|nr:SIS domain-containing protein [Anaerolineales bacterium]